MTIPQASNSNVVPGAAAEQKSTELLKSTDLVPQRSVNQMLATARTRLRSISDSEPTPPKAKLPKRPRAKAKPKAEDDASPFASAPNLLPVVTPLDQPPEPSELPTTSAVAAAAQPAIELVPAPAVQATAAPAKRDRPRRSFDFLHFVTIIVAVVLAVIAAYFSVSGMTRIFPGAEMAVIVMAATMEAGKLSGAAWLSRNWSVMGFGLKSMLTFLLVVLALINAIGVFGQLSAAHLNPHVSAMTANDTEAANQGARIEAQQRLVADLNRRIAQIDTAIEEATKRGRTTTAMELARDQRRNRAELVEQRVKEEETLIAMRTTQARIAGEQAKAAADVGVLQYAAALFGVDREQMIQVLILAMVLSCDPLSITLVIATAHRNQPRRRDQTA
jgi:hypothetical protein